MEAPIITTVIDGTPLFWSAHAREWKHTTWWATIYKSEKHASDAIKRGVKREGRSAVWRDAQVIEWDEAQHRRIAEYIKAGHEEE